MTLMLSALGASLAFCLGWGSARSHRYYQLLSKRWWRARRRAQHRAEVARNCHASLVQQAIQRAQHQGKPTVIVLSTAVETWRGMTLPRCN